MKKLPLLLQLAFITALGHAQTISDYYLPLCKDNFIHHYTPGVPNGWSERNSRETIIRTDVINGQTYYLQMGYEIEVQNPTDTDYYQAFWLKETPTGEIQMGAYDPTNTGNIDSAIILNPPNLFFSNAFLTVGYARSYSPNAQSSVVDSTVSITATVDSFTNCLHIRSTVKENGTITRVDDEYYAKGIGKVKNHRSLPLTEVHTSNITNYLAVDCTPTALNKVIKTKVEVYPNPAHTHLTIQMNQPPIDATISIYNMLGQKVMNRKLPFQTETISLETLTDGAYFYQIVSNNHEMTGKITVHK